MKGERKKEESLIEKMGGRDLHQVQTNLHPSSINLHQRKMLNSFELQRLRDLPIEGVAERLGLQVTRHKCLCPFHEDHHPSMSFSIRRNTYRCFVCGEHGGTIDLVMKYQRLGFKEACDFLNDGASFKYEIRNTNARKATCDVKTMLLLRRGLDRTESLTGIDEVKDEKLET